jgi:type IV pilus biogenesis protein CpaD/CtpE
MGIYDQLSNLDKTPTVAASEPPKKVEPRRAEDRSSKAAKPAVKRTTAPLKVTHPERNPKLPLDSGASPRRIITRASFEVYQDQIHALRQISLTAKLSDEQLSISKMVREALDSYLTDKNLK